MPQRLLLLTTPSASAHSSDPTQPNLFLATVAIAGHNRCPSPISSSVGNHCCQPSPLLSLLLLLLLPRLYPRSAAAARSHTTASPLPATRDCGRCPQSTSAPIYRPLLPTAASFASSSPPLLPQQSHIIAVLPSSTTTIATPSSVAAPSAHSPPLSPLLLPPASVTASLALSHNHRWALLTLTLQPPPSLAAIALVGLPLPSPSSLASSSDLTVVALAEPLLPPSLPLSLLPSSPQSCHCHPFFLPVMQPKVKAAAILPCCRSRLQPCPPHLFPFIATSVAALPNCRQ
ncbi:hypothetical protein B296_00015159 [Ensete ventricosum]|uniref:Uncharacterized protein n=1 Tax=Ensete ventricosum TaxID=4639 RepID=A0A426WZK4_ENSVE|nr:hypothetical protein B296_00015159 [Ensete ventricosum]